ncbi:hypothetical protein FIBSPDRAFT_903506 [Athelia psychrophila]|uniref:Uncharacterized protein n=1 Tax=Athelia psychrophila TaxID=1759441 RepID=A0A167VVV1_9AGAM|nr:hypothetical protein FIBSPDRAFT_903506 [Fibularhizoctonia sp. CBS 109695]
MNVEVAPHQNSQTSAPSSLTSIAPGLSLPPFSSGLVAETENIEAWDGTGVLGGLKLGDVEVGGDRDDSISFVAHRIYCTSLLTDNGACLLALCFLRLCNEENAGHGEECDEEKQEDARKFALARKRMTKDSRKHCRIRPGS